MASRGGTRSGELELYANELKIINTRNRRIKRHITRLPIDQDYLDLFFIVLKTRYE